jgi:indolepyruvate ferredoxin oxidoreductase beta subunit
MKSTNIYLCGVGGQGIALLSEVMIRACIEAGYEVKGVDTHGLAQRGGVVVSHLRIGQKVFTPMIPPGQADIVIAMERLEGLRGALTMLKRGGTLVYYNTVQQPTGVRKGEAQYPSEEIVEDLLTRREITIEKVFVPKLPDPRMQNVALLGRLSTMNLIDGLSEEILSETLRTIVPPHALETNLVVFEQARDAW